jgi:hypothetical protein
MPWPKGKPRKGHINADGTPHARKGDKLRVGVGVEVSRLPVGVDPFKEVPRKRQVEPNVSDVREGTEETVEVWGMTGTRPVTETCPKCRFAYADGGYCENCSWSAPIRRDEYGTHSGKRRK